jgi:hypothetical protein
VRDKIKVGNILIKEGTLLPETLRIEREACVRGWSLIANLDGYELDRQIRNAAWTFFCSAGEIRATVFGVSTRGMVHRAIERILAKAKSEMFNSLEITRMASVGSESFPGVHYITVSARSRHIQESMFLRGIQGPEVAKPIRDGTAGVAVEPQSVAA